MTTQPPDFRALCAELVAAYDSYSYADGGDAADRMKDAIDAARAALNAPPLAPIPVSEGLPGAKECDAKGRCWLSNSDTPYGWILDNPEQCTNYTHWLPHWAIPLPEVKE